MNQITLTLELVNAIAGYLGSKPYQETFQLIAEIQKQAAGQVPAETLTEASKAALAAQLAAEKALEAS